MNDFGDEQKEDRTMRVSALQRRNAGIELWEIAKEYKQFRSDLTDIDALNLAMLGNPDLGEAYLGQPVRRDQVEEVKRFLADI